MPGRSRDEPWDGTSLPPSEAWDAVLAASGASVPGGGEVVNALLELGIEGIDAPDVFGEVKLWTGEEYIPIPLETVDKDLHPIWDYVGWTDVELTTDTFVDVTLIDEDLTDDDNIGSVSLRYDLLVDAWVAGGGYWYEGSPVLDESGGTIVGVKLAVLSVD